MPIKEIKGIRLMGNDSIRAEHRDDNTIRFIITKNNGQPSLVDLTFEEAEYFQACIDELIYAGRVPSPPENQ